MAVDREQLLRIIRLEITDLVRREMVAAGWGRHRELEDDILDALPGYFLSFPDDASLSDCNTLAFVRGFLAARKARSW